MNNREPKGRTHKITMTTIRKIAMAAMSTFLSLALIGGLSEAYLRYQLANRRDQSPFFHNPIIAAQSSEEVFFPDQKLGHRLTPDFADVFGKNYDPLKAAEARKKNEQQASSFIGRNEILTLDNVVKALTPLDKTKHVILHVGDSSTTGWDSDVVSRNRYLRHRGVRAPPKSLENPFFRYPTYSDLLADDGLQTINAGVPGYTSTQGVRYIGKLLEEFKQAGIPIQYVTIYFGNNDSVWNGNTQDKYVLPNSKFTLKITGVLKTVIQDLTIYPRVDVEEYQENLVRIIEICREYDAKPILIRPLIPKYWHPGLRAKEHEASVWETMYLEKGKAVMHDLEEAIRLYHEADWLYYRTSGEEHRIRVRKLLVQAQQLDHVVPRIKPEYVQALHEIVEETGVPLIDVQHQIPTDDRSYFVDYCHPIEPANRLIASAIKELIF